jgi:hypothetical protein
MQMSVMPLGSNGMLAAQKIVTWYYGIPEGRTWLQIIDGTLDDVNQVARVWIADRKEPIAISYKLLEKVIAGGEECEKARLRMGRDRYLREMTIVDEHKEQELRQSLLQAEYSDEDSFDRLFDRD